MELFRRGMLTKPRHAFVLTLVVIIVTLATRLIWVPIQKIRSGVDINAWIHMAETSEHVHALSACVFAVLAVGAIVHRKGGKPHRLFGKTSILALFFAIISAAILLVYVSIENNSAGIYTNRTAIYENNAILLTLLLAGAYGGFTGYRWAVLHQLKLDVDLACGWAAILSSLLSICLVPIVTIVDPISTTNAGFPLTPVTAGFLLAGQGALLGYFGYDDLRFYYSVKQNESERITKHTYRIMTTVGAALTAIGIVHLGPIALLFPNMTWLLYTVPPSLIFALTLLLKQNSVKQLN